MFKFWGKQAWNQENPNIKSFLCVTRHNFSEFPVQKNGGGENQWRKMGAVRALKNGGGEIQPRKMGSVNSAGLKNGSGRAAHMYDPPQRQCPPRGWGAYSGFMCMLCSLSHFETLHWGGGVDPIHLSRYRGRNSTFSSNIQVEIMRFLQKLLKYCVFRHSINSWREQFFISCLLCHWTSLTYVLGIWLYHFRSFSIKMGC